MRQEFSKDLEEMFERRQDFRPTPDANMKKLEEYLVNRLSSKEYMDVVEEMIMAVIAENEHARYKLGFRDGFEMALITQKEDFVSGPHQKDKAFSLTT